MTIGIRNAIGGRGDRVSVSVTVAVAPRVAFAKFTQEIDLWWRRGVAYRASGASRGVLTLEPRVGGRLFEEYEGPAGLRVHEAGKVTLWDPPNALAFEWRGSNFAPGESTLVDIRFVPTESGTRLELVHSGFAALRPDHPVRHGKPAPEFIRAFGLWWGNLLTGFRVHVA